MVTDVVNTEIHVNSFRHQNLIQDHFRNVSPLTMMTRVDIVDIDMQIISQIKCENSIQHKGKQLVDDLGLTTRSDSLGDGGDRRRSMVVVDVGDGESGEITEDEDAHACVSTKVEK